MFGFMRAVKQLTILIIEISVAMQLGQNEVNKVIDKLLLFQALQTQSRSVSTRQICYIFHFLLTTVITLKKKFKL